MTRGYVSEFTVTGMSYNLRLFPEVYTNGTRPPCCGVIDQRLSLRTPAYGFGWVLSRVELFKALGITDEPPLKLWLNHLPEMVDDRICPRWETKGYDLYNPIAPECKFVGEDHILILMACNDSPEVMDSIMANKAYHDECRDCLGNPKTMMLEPGWFRVDLMGMPKGFIPGHQEDNSRPERSHVAGA